MGVALPAAADDWGCQVLLCLSNPNGPTAVSECVPPITKLWKALAKGHAFPTCLMASAPGNNNSAGMQWASADNCPPQYIRYTQNADNPQPYCMFAGAINVTVNNKLYSRTWWNGVETVVEYLTPEAKGPGASSRFEQDYAVWKKEQDRLAAIAAEEARRLGN